MFLNHKGMILTRKKLLDIVWGFDYFGEERTVDTHVRRLRKNWRKYYKDAPRARI